MGARRNTEQQDRRTRSRAPPPWRRCSRLAGAIILTPAVRAADGLAALLVAFLMVRSARERAGRPATVTSIGPSIPARSRHNAAAHESGPCRS
jgi:hypothetical protein